MKALLAVAFFSILRVAVMNLECFSYQGPASQLGQQQQETIRVCAPSEQHCFTTLLSYQGLLYGKMLLKGCSEGGEPFCNKTTMIEKNQVISTTNTRCCKGNICNRALFSAKDIDVPGELDCLACNGDPRLCGGYNLPAVRCSAGETQCVEMSIAGSLKGGERMKRMMKGCGKMTPCGGLAAFSNGEHPLSYSAHVKCCNGSECNGGAFSEVDPGSENGVECHSCSETGKGECSPKNVKSMKCLGAMTQCMVIRGQTSDQTLMCGCATKPFCQGLYPDFKLTATNRITCCTGSLCNHGESANIKTSE